ncbi:stAR-related lipid transfer protein 7, mitochondrial [Dorcoceras hygrometricum]|uniref:StAR-related lipid transfer protein 7, mitochondrial n=1 Tax=Dorcoceras hygrometricum TaxID=472368 RepID=A0A2Z7BUG0_9LAMI|nr:stAR-related lipid transfer protein 7, mitochondrial [Dorcoceras hygrometricum]
MNEVELGDGWVLTWTLAVILLIFICTLLRSGSRGLFLRGGGPIKSVPSRPLTPLRNPVIISDSDLKNLIDDLDDSHSYDNVSWENVCDKRNNHLSYKAKFCKPKDGPLKYLSTTTFENCSVELLVNFYMDNCYRMLWDKTVVRHESLHGDQGSGIEIGRTIKKFPFLTPREYVLAWRLWQGRDGSFYCFSKECEHPSAPRQRGYVRVLVFRSGWRIRKVPGRNACEIRMVHQEDAGLNVEMAKLAFAKGIWSYVCKMDDALRKYSSGKQLQLNSTASATMFVEKVPPEFEVTNNTTSSICSDNSTASVMQPVGTRRSNIMKLTKRPSNKLISNGIILLGGAICLSRGHSSLGAKVAVAYMLSKLTRRNVSSNQATENQCNKGP